MKIAVAGSTGLIGSALMDFFGPYHQMVRIVRRNMPGFQKTILWDPLKGGIETDKLEGFDAVVNLAGENIGTRWSKELKKKIRESRINSASLISRTIAALKRPPSVFLCASAVGFYGDRGDEELDETSTKGRGFLSDVVYDWERATDPLRDKGIRTINMRFGPVMSEKGGTLKKLLPAFKLGLGGRLGSGKQFLSWVALDEIPLIVKYLIENESIHGPVNAVSPCPVTNREFTKILGSVLRRPTLFGLPVFFINAIFGEMAKEVILPSTRVNPGKLLSSNYVFNHAGLEQYLDMILKK